MSNFLRGTDKTKFAMDIVSVVATSYCAYKAIKHFRNK